MRLADTAASVEQGVLGGLERGDFFLEYQPRFSTGTGEVVAIEALVRWHGSERGPMGPRAFLPRVADTGAMLELGRWVRREASWQAGRWERRRPAQARPVAVSINVAARELLEPGFVEEMRTLPEDGGLPNEQIQLEVDAADPLRSSAAFVARIQVLRHLGISVAIDRVGPSTALAGDLIAVDGVHLGQHWVRGVESDPELVHAASTLVERVHESGGKVCATGVEHQLQADILAELGCDELQGFLLSEPVAPDLLDWIDPAGD